MAEIINKGCIKFIIIYIKCEYAKYHEQEHHVHHIISGRIRYFVGYYHLKFENVNNGIDDNDGNWIKIYWLL